MSWPTKHLAKGLMLSMLSHELCFAIPTTIADNAGLDGAELIAQLRAEHHKENNNAGIDVITGSVGDMSELEIYEAFKVKQAVLLSATKTAETILRVDEIITCAPRREDRM
ncbi:T-complex protein 1 subunit beta [Artemisia annua]|uniref:T-complex protein 1 subunit beta n=1 Tax=Artemisia annua TaxID=35608 RepID=A0A2U1NDV1_ARTAN|nr:T-complex protein 1 subunit beta [Artemisia annua]PWA94125.1 T-complex protein 1 subunit beta [Artemisia annua]